MVDLPSDGTKRVTQAAGLILVGLSVAVLIAWYIHFTPLIQIVPTLAPMQRMTALCFLLSGCALILTSAGRQQATTVLALVVLILAMAVILEYALSADFGIDQLLGRDYINVRTSHPGRMSPVTAFCILCSSLALLATASRLPARFASAYVGIVASILMAVGAVNVFGHLLGYTETFVWGHFSRMALHTSAAFALLGTGLMAWAWKKGHVEKGAPEWLPLSIGLGLAAGALGVWQALIAHEHQEGDLSLLSRVILAGGLLGALLVAVAVAQTQQARRRTQESQESNMFLQRLFDVAPDGLVMTDRQGTIIRVNQQAEEIFGYARGELIAQPIERLIPEKLHDLHHTHREGYHAAPSPRPMGHGLELRARRKDLSEFPVEIGLTELQSTEQGILVVAVVRDITERKLAEEALRQSEERFRSVFEQGQIGVSLMGMDRRMFMVNATMCRMLGYSAEELTRMTPLDITYPDDKDLSVDLMEHLFERDFPAGRIEKRYVRKNGEIMWGNLTASVIRDPEGKPLYSVGLIEDITERKQAEAELRLGNEIFANMEEGVCLVRIDDGIIVHTNPRFSKMFGYGLDELTGTEVTRINADYPRRPEEVAEEIRVAIRRSGVWRGEILHRRKDGTLFWCAVTVSLFQHPKFGGVGISVHQDITELKRAQETMRASEERFRGIFEQGPIGVALLGLDHRMNKVNPAFCRMLGYSEAELARMTPLDMTYPDDQERCMDLLGRLDKGEIPVCRMEKRYVKKSGELMWVSLTASVIRDQEGRPLHGLGMIEDITERREAEQKLMEQAALLDLAGDAIIVLDMEGRILFWNRGAVDTYGWSAEEAVAQIIHTLLQTRSPIPLQEIKDAILEQGRWEGELEHVTRDGNAIVVTSRWSLRRNGNGAPSGYLEINRDITARKHTEEQLRSLTERLSLATRSASIGVWDWDLRTNTTVWDDAMFEMFGIPKVVPMAYEEFARLVLPEDMPKVEASLARAIREKTQDAVEFRIIRPGGPVRHIYSAEGVVLDEHGNVVRVVGTAVDITKRKQMEAQIEANKEQLVTSARLSALGMMAGGIAHEINNPLGIIHALASDLIDVVKEDGAAPPAMVARNSTRIRETADRIARIIKSLRQISREGSDDTFQPAPIGRILEETLEVCRARFKANAVKLLLPERIPEISIHCREVQIAQILLNLLQNAFDAVVEQKGERWVRLEVTAGEDSVVISVMDSGPGIPPELRPRIMEPFFTTKPIGKGTGLGLSLSKTIAEEHGGKLEFGEKNGRTCFSLALPLVREAETVWN